MDGYIVKRILSKEKSQGFWDKEHLVARVFAAAEMGIAALPTAEERIAATKREKAQLLDMPNGSILPETFTLKEGWVKESVCMNSWPPIFLSDIAIFLMADHPGSDVDFHIGIYRRLYGIQP